MVWLCHTPAPSSEQPQVPPGIIQKQNAFECCLLCWFCEIMSSPEGFICMFVLAWVLSGYFGFLQQYKNMYTRLVSGSKLLIGVSANMCGCLSICEPTMDCWPAHSVYIYLFNYSLHLY